MSYFRFDLPNPIVAFPSALRGLPILGLILLLGPFLSSATLAQRGGEAAFAVRVTDEEGAPIAGAQVLAQPSEAGTAGAPPAVTTDELGQAVVAGLTEGEWFVEVSHPGYMLFAAYIELRSGKKPQVGFSSQVNTDTSWKPMTVKFLKASPEARRGATTQRPAQTPPPEVVRPPAKKPVEEPEPPRVVRPERPDETDREGAATESGEIVTEQPMAEDEERQAAREAAMETPAEEPSEAAAEAQGAPAPPPSEAATTPEAEVTDPEVVTTQPSPSAPEETPSAESEEPESEEPESERPGSGRSPGKPAEEPDALEAEPAARPRTPPVEPTAGDPLAGQPVRPEDVESPPPEVAELPAVEESSPVPPGLEPGEIEPTEPRTTEPTEAPTDPEPTSTETRPEPEAKPDLEPGARAEPAPEVEAEARAAPPEPEPSSAPATEPADASPTGAVGRVPRFLRSAAAGTCSECEPGEWAVAAEQEAARAGESRREQQCSQSFVDGAAEAARLLADSDAPRLEAYAGPLLTAMWRLEPEGRDAAEDLLGPRTDPASHCQLAGAVLPAGAEFTGYVIEAWDVLGGRACLAGFDCAVGQARWLGEPEVVVGDERIVVYGIFKNRSTRRERRARLTIHFRPPSDDWVPAMR